MRICAIFVVVLAVFIKYLLQFINSLRCLFELNVELLHEVLRVFGDLDILFDKLFAARLLLDLANIENVVDGTDDDALLLRIFVLRIYLILKLLVHFLNAGTDDFNFILFNGHLSLLVV